MVKENDILHFPGALSLTEQLDQLVLVSLVNNKQLVGNLTVFDQYGNLVLENASEWLVLKNKLATKPLGLFIIKSDQIIMLSSFDEAKIAKMNLEQISIEEMNELMAAV